jgi:hypothetical protein
MLEFVIEKGINFDRLVNEIMRNIHFKDYKGIQVVKFLLKMDLEKSYNHIKLKEWAKILIVHELERMRFLLSQAPGQYDTNLEVLKYELGDKNVKFLLKIVKTIP